MQNKLIRRIYKQGDIIWVRFPFSDKPDKARVRPAIVVSNRKSNKLDNDLLICPITTTLRDTPFSFVINISDVTISLPEKSEIRCNKIYTLRNYFVISKLSYLKKDKHRLLIDKIYSCIKNN